MKKVVFGLLLFASLLVLGGMGVIPYVDPIHVGLENIIPYVDPIHVGQAPIGDASLMNYRI